MESSAVDTDVLIVGAGPVGLFLANECARRGLRWRLIETRAGQSEHSKALAIFPRTLEIFDMAGVVGPFLKVANRVTSVAVLTRGRPLAHVAFHPEETPYSFIAMVPQDVTERLLVEALRRKGGSVEYETTFQSAEPQDGLVRVVAEHKRRSEPVTIRASFVVGCDGAHSAIRHFLNIPFEGARYDATFLLADVDTSENLPADELELCPSDLGPLAIFPMSARRRRVVATIDEPEGEAPSLELVRRILGERGPHGIEALALHWSSYFRIHHRHVGRLRSDRFFLAGDAAHIHSPFGGQGMNTGLQDVWNLAWKLDLTLRGRGGEPLLESYSAERLPVIERVLAMTHAMTQVMGTPNKVVQALRDTFIPLVTRLTSVQHAFVEKLSELDIGYSGSPIVDGAGKRYFDDSMRGGDGILRRFLLFRDERGGSEAPEAEKALYDVYRNVLEPRPSRNRGMTLVRPDGYVAFASGGADAQELESVRSVLQRQLRDNL